MNSNSYTMALFVIIILLLGSCNMPKITVTAPDKDSGATKVALTLVALTQSAHQTPLDFPTISMEKQPTVTKTPTQPSSETNQPTVTHISTAIPTNTSEPSTTPTTTQISKPTNTYIPAPGTIAGNIFGYPYGSVPSLSIVAFGQEPPYNYSWLITGAGETNYSMGSSYLIPGHFQVVAYDSFGHAGGCTVFVLVISNQIVNCDITNWGGGFPAKPSGVPFP
jgi:uncharacterized membrane protein